MKKYPLTIAVAILFSACSPQQTERHDNSSHYVDCTAVSESIVSLLSDSAATQADYEQIVGLVQESSCGHSDDNVRALLASAIVQGARNGKHNLSIETYLNEARELSRSSQFSVYSNAHTALSYGDLEQDAQLLFKLSKGASQGAIRSIVISLVKMCNPVAKEGLKLLRGELSNEERVFLDNYSVDFDRTFERDEWCDRH